MKRLITFISLIIVIILGYSLINKGFKNDAFPIASYETIETKSEALTKKLASYDKKNQDEYDTAISTLNSTIKMYNDSKTKYTEIYEELADVLNIKDDDNSNEVLEVYSDKEKYNVDFLNVILGNYAEKEGVDVTFRLVTSSTVDPNSETMNYFLSDLEFTVTGSYMNIVNFVSDLENDDKLGWEIRKFEMVSGSAQFVIKDIPINSESYLESANYSVNDFSENIEQNTNSMNETSSSGSNQENNFNEDM